VIELGPLTLGHLAQANAPEAGGLGPSDPALSAVAAVRTPASAAALSALLDETLQLVHRLRRVAEQVDSRGTLSGGRRGVLTELERSGPRTVPQVARARSVTRQQVQALVNALAREGLVEFADNPEHRRSRLVRLTPAGRAWLAETTERVASLLRRLELDASDEEVRAATGVLRQVGRALANDAWQSPRSERMGEAY
jgi:DNA-binding MarR family transcriptional regulator